MFFRCRLATNDYCRLNIFLSESRRRRREKDEDDDEEEEEDENNKILGTRINEEEAARASIDDAAHFVCTVVVSLLISTYFQAFSFNAFSKTRRRTKIFILFSFLHISLK